MPRLFQIKDSSCKVFDFDDFIEIDLLKFQKEPESLSVFKEGIRKSIKSHQFIKLDDKIYGYDDCKDECWYLYPLKDETLIGRSKECNIRLKNKLVSSIHVRITKVEDEVLIKDEHSTNKIYVNGSFIDICRLNYLDQIIILDTIMYFLGNYLIINHKVDGCSYPSIVPNQRNLTIPLKSTIEVENVEPIVYEIESPVSLEQLKKPSLFSSIGSSVMIILSSVLSSLVLMLVSDVSKESFLTMIFSSLSMSFAFLIYGLLNRNISIKSEEKVYQSSLYLYLNYLDEVRKDVLKLRCTMYERLCANKNLFLELNDLNFCMCKDDFKIAISNSEFHWISFKKNKTTYQNKDQFLFKKRDDLISELSSSLQDFKYIYSNQKVWIKHKPDKLLVNTIFMQLIWQNLSTKRKLVFVGEPFDLSDYLDHSICTLNKKRLLVISKSDLYDIQKMFDDSFNVIYLVFDCSLINFETFDNTTLIYMSNSPCLLHFDKVIDDDFIKMDINNLCVKKSIYAFNQMDSFISFDYQKFDLNKAWSKTRVCLNVEIGYDENFKPIMLDLSEKGYGPHGLIAGTTGSGKSEWLSNLLMMLVINNSSKYFQYVLIDFKGEAFGQAFSQFSHCAGIISNLDDRAMERFSLSMNSEILSRQRKLKEMMEIDQSLKAHIDIYNEHFKNDPIPHLFVVVDEFAQLKSKYSEYMSQLIEMARIGRSLGIHLLLSTQKPMGIVDEQIWSNSNLKVCLKVNSESDSREILHNSSAADLCNPGEFIMQSTNRKQVKGQAYYLHAKLDHNKFYEVDKKDRILFEKMNDEHNTIYNDLCQRIYQIDTDRHWVIMPDLERQKDFDDGLFRVDMPYIQRQVSLELNKHLCVLTHEPYKLLKSILSRYKNCLIYLCGFEKFSEYVDECIDSQELLLKLDKAKDNSIVIVNGVINISEFKTFKGVVVSFISSYQDVLSTTLNQFRLKLAYSIKDIDSIRLFFDDYRIRNVKHPTIYYDNHLCKCVFCKPAKLSIKVNKEIIKIENNDLVLVGTDIETNTRIFHEKSKVLAICFVQQSIKDKIMDLVLSWQKKDENLTYSFDLKDTSNIYILYMPQIDMVEFNLKQFDVDILWVGLGFMEYSYLIKRRSPIDIKSNIIYFHEDTVNFIKEIEHE